MEWNRRDFVVKPILVAGTASVFGRTDSLLTKLLGDSGPLIQRTLGKTGLTMPVVSMGVMNADIPGLLRRSYEGIGCATGSDHRDQTAHAEPSSECCRSQAAVHGRNGS